MTQASVETIFRKLNDAGVRYLVAGGLAAVAHGVVRFTADVDLIVALDPENLERTVRCLSSLRFSPRAPVPFAQFSDPSMRDRWTREKGMTVFSLSSPEHPLTEVDLFAQLPFDFERAYLDALHVEVAPGVVATFVSKSDLIAMKRSAGRPRDLEDVRALEASDEVSASDGGGDDE